LSNCLIHLDRSFRHPTPPPLLLQDLNATYPRIASVPFESEHKFMATMHQDGAKRVMYVKGAPERLLPICSSQVDKDDQNQTGDVDAKMWANAQAELSSQGLRVLAICRSDP
jgi:magnesium-transporting ATPase (P-type)